MTTRFASDAAAGGDGSASAPYRDPGDLPSPWLLTPGEEYLFHTDTPFNFTGNFANTGYTTSPIVLGSWGGNGRAVIKKYRMLDRSECVEVEFTSGDTTGLASGTNLWRVPVQFFGMFFGKVWGVRCDVTGVPTGVAHTPNAAREWCNSDSSAYAVIYSQGNPVDVYGGVYVTNTSDSDYATAYKRGPIYAQQPGGGLTVDGIDFEEAYSGLRTYCGSVAGAHGLLPGLSIQNVAVRSLLNGTLLVGDGSRTTPFNGSGNGFVGAVLRNLYAENLGGTILQTPSSGLCLNRLRLSDSVINGCCKATSSGGIYLDHCYTTDGERGIIERIASSGVEAYNYFPTDGYDFYSENSTGGFEWRHLFSSSEQHFHFNYPGANNVVRQCVAVAHPGAVPSNDDFLTIQGAQTGSEITVIGCVSIGLRRFVKSNAGSGSFIVKVRENVSRSDGDIGGTSNANAVRSTSYSSSNWVVNGNNFYGHDYDIYDATGGADHSSDATNKITTDPATEIARIPVPTDPTVNYALMISPNFWNGTVDLRPGTRLVAA